jgi:hypothetical protein
MQAYTRGLLLLTVLALSGCAVKGYEGVELLDNQMATVTLKAPVASLIPLFWIFPFNTLTWLAEDWYETTWTDSITVNRKTLNRFKTVLVKPGNIAVDSLETEILDKEQIGSESCSNGSCSCKETIGKDGKKETACEQTINCVADYRVYAKDNACELTFNAKSGQHYDVFIRKNNLMVQDYDNQILATDSCGVGPKYSYKTSDSYSKTESCSSYKY